MNDEWWVRISKIMIKEGIESNNNHANWESFHCRWWDMDSIFRHDRLNSNNHQLIPIRNCYFQVNICMCPHVPSHLLEDWWCHNKRLQPLNRAVILFTLCHQIPQQSFLNLGSLIFNSESQKNCNTWNYIILILIWLTSSYWEWLTSIIVYLFLEKLDWRDLDGPAIS